MGMVRQVTMRLEIITAERKVYDDDVELVVVPGSDGELGILSNHAPLMSTLQPGELVIRKEGEDTYLAVSGGFIEVLDDRVTVLADAAEKSDEIDEQRALAAMERARDSLANRESYIELEQVAVAMRRAQIRLNVVRRRRNRTGITGGRDSVSA
jgi:F-type H+-transporting ATPase subunit epsilon